jgi:hypothetical protein
MAAVPVSNLEKRVRITAVIRNSCGYYGRLLPARGRYESLTTAIDWPSDHDQFGLKRHAKFKPNSTWLRSAQ